MRVGNLVPFGRLDRYVGGMFAMSFATAFLLVIGLRIVIDIATHLSFFEPGDDGQVPTLAETYPGFEYVGWFALLAPMGTPSGIVLRVNRDVDKVLGDPEVAQRLFDLGLVNEGAGTIENLNDFLRAERERWAKLAKDIGVQPE